MPTNRITSFLKTFHVELLGLLILGLNMMYFYPFFTDDALISLRYAERWSEGRGLTWNDGEYVEGFSNILWVMLTGIAHTLGANAIWIARLMGIGLTIGTGWMMLRLIQTYHRENQLSQYWVWIYAAMAPVGVWAIAGLEMPLVSFLLLLTIGELVRASPRYLLAALYLSLLCLTRPDGPLLVAGLAAGWGWLHGFRWQKLRTTMVWVLIPAMTVLGLTLFRLYYYHDWLPNTAYVKVDSGQDRIVQGLMYMARFGYSLLFGVILLFWIFWQKLITFHSVFLRLLLPVFLLWAGYVILIGGDYFPAFRLHLPLLAPGLIMLQGSTRLTQKPAIWLSLFLPIFFVSQSLLIATNWVAKIGRGEWKYRKTGLLLRESFADSPRKPLIALGAAGSIPYFSGLPALDILGLNDRTIAKTRPAVIGPIGHDRANTDYVMARKPDLMVFDTIVALGQACLIAEEGIFLHPTFIRDYTLSDVRIMTPDRWHKHQPTEIIPFPANTGDWQNQSHTARLAIAWFAPLWGIDSSFAGIKKVPAVMMGQPPHAVTWADGQGFTVSLGRDFPRESIRLGPLAAGTWRVETVPPVPARFRLSVAGDTTLSQAGGVWVHPGGAAYLACAADSLPAQIHALHLTRIADAP